MVWLCGVEGVCRLLCLLCLVRGIVWFFRLCLSSLLRCLVSVRVCSVLFVVV